MRILVTGSRDWTDEAVIAAAIRDALGSNAVERVTLVHGGARGADAIADAVWKSLIQQGMNLLPAKVYAADWDRYGKSAGHRRNAEMVNDGADVCLAFPLGESRGTRGCMRLARNARIKVLEYEPGSTKPITLARMAERVAEMAVAIEQQALELGIETT